MMEMFSHYCHILSSVIYKVSLNIIQYVYAHVRYVAIGFAWMILLKTYVHSSQQIYLYHVFF